MQPRRFLRYSGLTPKTPRRPQARYSHYALLGRSLFGGKPLPRYYPIFLDVQDRRAVVFGGDHEAERKARYLVECGANVTLFSPESALTTGLQELTKRGSIDLTPRGYVPGDLEGAWLAIVADTSDEETNRLIHEEARDRNVVLNVMDVTHLCTFIAPAIVQRKDVTVAVSTAGTSPALARRLRERMSDTEHCRCLEWADMGPVLAAVRADVRSRHVPVTPQDWQDSMTGDLLEQFKGGDHSGAKAELTRRLEERGAAREEENSR